MNRKEILALIAGFSLISLGIFGILIGQSTQTTIQKPTESATPNTLIPENYKIELQDAVWSSDWINVTWSLDQTIPAFLNYTDTIIDNNGTRLWLQGFAPSEAQQEAFGGGRWYGDAIHISIHNPTTEPFTTNMTITQVFHFDDGTYQILCFAFFNEGDVLT